MLLEGRQMDTLANLTRRAASPGPARAVAPDGPEPFPLTDLQEAYVVGMSRLIELGGIRPAFYLEMDVVGLDPGRTEAAINLLVARHEQLRTVPVGDGGQRVLPAGEPTPVRIPVTDVSNLTPAGQQARFREIEAGMLDDGPDPARWPLFRIAISRVRPQRCRVHVAISLLLADAQSLRLLIDEFCILHENPAAALPSAPLTFRQSRRALADGEHTEAYRAQWRYWADRMASLPAAPELPLARPPASIGSVRFQRRECRLDRAEWKQLRANCGQHKITPAAGLASLFAETLGAWASAPRFCLNVLHLHWRDSRPGWDRVIGQLGATLPLEVDLSHAGDFWQRGQRLQDQLGSDFENADVTAVRVMRELAARRGRSSRAVLPYVFTSMLGLGAWTSARARPAARMVTSGLATPHVLIDNHVQDASDGGIWCVWDVVDEAFPAGLPEQMFEVYQRGLHALAAPGGAQVSPDLIPSGHRDRVAAASAQTEPAITGRLEDGFLRQAGARPDADAVISSRRTVTYGQLEAESRGVAAWLRARGVGRGDLVAIVMTRGWEQVTAALGALRAGAAYCPIDATLPAARIRQLLEQGQARAVLVQPGSGSGADPGYPVPVLPVVRDMPAGPPLAAVPDGPAELAYVIYTSGSTGQPKGVMIEHGSAVNTIRDINRRIGMGARDRAFGISLMSFDLSVWDVFGSLAAGAALVMPDAEPDPVAWAATAAAPGVPVWNSVPMLAEMLAEVAGDRAGLSRAPIRAFLLSGDWIPLSLPGRLRALWPATRIVALGGATEASIWSNSFEVGSVDPGWPSIPYGSPLTNQTMRVLDHRLDVRPPWAAGRIYIGGDGVARGYLNDAHRTAERFIIHPVTGERLYWTGDLGRYRSDAIIELLGREDRQLKVQGFRIEPGEVESAVRDCPGVRECAVGAVTGPAGQRHLVALAVPEPGAQPDAVAIIARLRARLPAYMVPARVHVTEHLPLTSNGKVDISRALAELPSPAGPGSGPGEDSRGRDLAARLAALAAEVLQVTEIGADADFFAAGGTSLLALRLVNRLRSELGVDIPIGQVFESATPRELAACITDGRFGRPGAVELGRGTGQGLTLFHPVGGSVAAYSELARSWPGPVRAFQSPALTSHAAPDEAHLEDMAARYREELQRLEPAGPYVLGGWSMGGVLAYEAARQLATGGHKACVVMIDSHLDGPADGCTEADRQVAFLTDLASGQLPAAVAAELSAAPAAALTRVARDRAVARGLLPDGLNLPDYERLAGVHAHNLAVLGRYRPPRTTVPVLLVSAAAGAPADATSSWRAVCPDLQVQLRPCDHYSIVNPAELRSIAAYAASWAAAALRR
jgi:amino acid adenylation domain-containing protein